MAIQACRLDPQKFNISSRSAMTKAPPSAWTEDAEPTINGMGLSKADKVALTNVSLCKTGGHLDVWMGSVTVWTCIFLYQGGAALQHWVHKTNHLGNGLPVQPPPNVLHAAVHKFTPCDADTATLEAMVEQGKLLVPGALQRCVCWEAWASATSRTARPDADRDQG